MDFPISLQIFYSTENQRGFKKRGDSPTTFPQQFVGRGLHRTSAFRHHTSARVKISDSINQ